MNTRTLELRSKVELYVELKVILSKKKKKCFFLLKFVSLKEMKGF